MDDCRPGRNRRFSRFPITGLVVPRIGGPPPPSQSPPALCASSPGHLPAGHRNFGSRCMIGSGGRYLRPPQPVAFELQVSLSSWKPQPCGLLSSQRIQTALRASSSSGDNSGIPSATHSASLGAKLGGIGSGKPRASAAGRKLGGLVHWR